MPSSTLPATAAAPALDTALAPRARGASHPALRQFLRKYGDRIWERFGFVDAFSEERDWFADTFLAIDQGPIVIMIENHRTGLLWKLFMRIPEIQAGLRKLGFSSPHFGAA